MRRADQRVEQKVSIPKEKLEEYKESFKLFDKNDDGKISPEEIYEVLKTYGQESTIEEVRRMVADLDADESGELDFNEFIAFMQRMQSEELTEEEEVIRAFQTFDKDRNGYLSCAEFKHILVNLGDRFTEAEVEEIFREADLNGDGKLEYREFVEFWKDK